MRLDWGRFIPERRVVRTWILKRERRTCAVCGCTPDKPCTIALEGGGRAACIPAGTFRGRRCSRCQ